MSKSDPPSLKLDAPFMKEAIAYGLDAFDDQEEITSTTMEAAKAIVSDQKTNRDNSARSLFAILNVLIKMRKEQRAWAQRTRQLIYTVLVVFATISAIAALDKFGLIKITLH